MNDKHYSIYSTLDINTLRKENPNFINEKLRPYDPAHPYKLQSWGVQNQLNRIMQQKQEEEKTLQRIKQGPQITDIGVKAKYNDKEYLKQVQQRKLQLQKQYENTSQVYQQEGRYFTASPINQKLKNVEFYEYMCKSPQERLVKLLKEKEIRDLEEEKECHVGLSITEMGKMAQSKIEESTQRKIKDMRTKINVESAQKEYTESLSRSMVKDPVQRKQNFVKNFQNWQDQKKNGKKFYYGQASTLNQSSITINTDQQVQSLIEVGPDIIDMSVFKQEVMDYLNQSI